MKCRTLVFSLFFSCILSSEAEPQNTAPVSGVTSIKLCGQFVGLDAGAKMASCIAELPSTGGTADARSLEGTQTIARTISDSGKHIEILLGAGTYTTSVHPAFE